MPPKIPNFPKANSCGMDREQIKSQRATLYKVTKEDTDKNPRSIRFSASSELMELNR